MTLPGERSEPLPDGGLQVLTDLITHQDTATWTALSVFLAADFLLVYLWVQTIPTNNRVGVGTIGTLGLLTTLSSWLITRRSNQYLEAYYDLAKRRCNAVDLEIFNVKVRRKFRGKEVEMLTTTQVLRYLHLAFGLVWLVVSLGYFFGT
jgi:hypothetical protein